MNLSFLVVCRVSMGAAGWARFFKAASTNPSTIPSIVDWKLMLRIFGLTPRTAVTFLATISLVLWGGPKLTFLPVKSIMDFIEEPPRQKMIVSLAWIGNKERMLSYFTPLAHPVPI